MRILLVNDYFAPHAVGGAEILVDGLAAGLQTRGHEVMLATARIGDAKARERINDVDITRIGRFPPFRRAARLGSGTAPGRLSSTTAGDFRALLRSFCPDVVHFHNVWLLGPAIVRLASGQKGITLHDYWPICVRRSMLRVNWRPCSGPSPIACRLCRLRAPADMRSLNLVTLEAERADHIRGLATCDFVTAPSSFMAERIAKAGPLRPLVVYNGIDGDGTLSEPPRAPAYALFAGRPTREKGYEIARGAFALPSMGKYRLLVAAAAPPSGLSNVLIMGQQPHDHMPHLIAGASCVIVPSIWPENCPMIVLEALQAGVPVVGSRIGGIPELVTDGETGILVSPGNVNDLAAGIRHCFDETAPRRLAQHHGPATVRERFSREQMITRLETIYAA
jgi:glycosyltransferase involved in cell wall biosynthesis